MAGFIEGLNAFTGWLAFASVKATLLITLILSVQYSLRKYLSANARHSLWLSLLICLSIPFGWNLTLAQPFASDTSNAIHKAAIKPEIISTLAITHQTNTVEKPAQSGESPDPMYSLSIFESFTNPNHLHSLISYIWLTGFCSLMTITLWQIKRFHRILSNAMIASPQLYALMDSCKKTLGVNKNINLVCSTEIPSPFNPGDY